MILNWREKIAAYGTKFHNALKVSNREYFCRFQHTEK